MSSRRMAPVALCAARLRTARVLIGTAAVLFAVLAESPAAAGQETDIVTLTNGDQVTGEIKGVDRGLLRLKTSGFGTVEIKWSHVIGINTDKELEIDLASGQRVFGSLKLSDETGMIDITIGGETMSVAHDDVARVWPIGTSFWTRQDGKLDMGFSYSGASNQLQFNLNLRNDYNGHAFRVPVTVSSTVSRVGNDTNTNRHVVSSGYSRILGRSGWYALGVAAYQHNAELDLDFRFTGGGGVGRYFLESSRHSWGTYVALAVSREQFSLEPAATTFDVIVGTNLQLYFYGDHTFTLALDVQAIPSLSVRGRFRLELNSSVSYEFVHDLYVSLNIYDQYDSKPSQPTALKNDFSTSVTVGYKW